MAELFLVRVATPDDAAVIAWHRARMFQDMGQLPDPAFEPLRARSEMVLADWLKRGEYLGWLASPAGAPDTVAGGAGVQLRQVLPHPLPGPNGGVAVAAGRHAIVLNVFTEQPWRRQGEVRRCWKPGTAALGLTCVLGVEVPAYVRQWPVRGAQFAVGRAGLVNRL